MNMSMTTEVQLQLQETVNSTTTAWPFVDSPWDLLTSCRAATTDKTQQVFCTLSTMLGVISIYIFPIFGTFGLISNIHIFYIFTRRIGNPSRQTIYLAFLAVSDFLSILTLGWLWMVPAKGLPWATSGRVYFFTYNHGDPVCRFFRYWDAATNCMSTSSFLLVCFDRFLAIYFPFRMKKFGLKSARIAVALVAVASFVIAVPFIPLKGYVQTAGGVTICTLLKRSVFWEFYTIFFCKVGLFQSAMIMLINIALIVKLKLIFIERNKLTRSSTINNTGANGGGQQSSTFSRQETEATILILILSIFMLICAVAKATSSFMLFVIKFSDGDPILRRFLWNIGDISFHLYFFQESTNWLIYVWRMPAFRVKALYCCYRNGSSRSGCDDQQPNTTRGNIYVTDKSSITVD